MALKLCPRCRTEYVGSALRCSDCGGELVLAEGFSPPPAEAAGDALPPAQELMLVRTGAPADLESFALHLQELGISSRIESHPPGRSLQNAGARSAGPAFRLGLYVRPGDHPAASGAIDALIASALPDAVDPAARGEVSGCPACGAAIEPGAGACADCGLEFPSPEQFCAECGALGSPGDASCRACGAALAAG